MRTEARNIGWMLLVAAMLPTFEGTTAASDNKNARASNRGANLTVTSDVRVSPPSENPTTTDVAPAPTNPVIRPAIASTTRDDIDRNIERLSSTMKNLFKNLRPGSCPTVPARRPTSAWPSRAEAAISVCRP
jgi:hypothetical protein